MTPEQLTEQVIKLNGDVSALTQDVKSAHHRINDNDRVIESIHKMAVSVEALTVQVEHLANAAAESSTKMEESIKGLGARVGELEKKPAKRWDSLVAQLITIGVAALAGGLFSKLLA